MSVQSSSVGVCIVTYRARDLLDGCIRPLARSPLAPRILVVNSSSNDGTIGRALELGADTWVIPRGSFNHGTTREAARKRLGTGIVVMMTPDARPLSCDFLERLTRPILDGLVDMTYARQLARPGADVIERFIRAFNYPTDGGIRSLDDWDRYGNYSHFCSNSCAAWRQDALDAIGGFRHTLVSEETVAARQLLEAGRRIAYVPEALVVHSHPGGLLRDFRRQFDIGYSRAQFRDLLLSRGRDEERGIAFLAALIRHLWNEQPHSIPYALLHTAMRFLGYRLGMLGRHLPEPLAAHMSQQDFFWQRNRQDGPLAADPRDDARPETA
ncbi:MAG: glycosyltransferase family 2 protein [Geminicoccaceae bacterium]|nr:glycosyltransferase family 2 protein [Geminicoccaceae bacterium]